LQQQDKVHEIFHILLESQVQLTFSTIKLQLDIAKDKVQCLCSSDIDQQKIKGFLLQAQIHVFLL